MSQKFDNFNFFPQFVNPQGGAPGTITIEQGGIPVSGSPVSGLNFTNPATPITISGGVATVNLMGEGSGVSAVTASSPLASSGGATPNITLAGTVSVPSGGTGNNAFTSGAVLLGNGSSALQVVAPGTSGNVLTSNGTTWTSAAASVTAPAAPANSVQFNNAGVFGGSANLTWSGTTLSADNIAIPGGHTITFSDGPVITTDNNGALQVIGVDGGYYQIDDGGNLEISAAGGGGLIEMFGYQITVGGNLEISGNLFWGDGPTIDSDGSGHLNFTGAYSYTFTAGITCDGVSLGATDGISWADGPEIQSDGSGNLLINPYSTNNTILWGGGGTFGWSDGPYMQTDGSGNFTLANPNTGSYTIGNSNGSIYLNGDETFLVAGTSITWGDGSYIANDGSGNVAFNGNVFSFTAGTLVEVTDGCIAGAFANTGYSGGSNAGFIGDGVDPTCELVTPGTAPLPALVVDQVANGTAYAQINNDGSAQFANSSFNIDASGNLTTSGNLDVTVVGKGLRVAEGSNAKQGASTLVGGTVVVSNTSVTANSRIFLTGQNASGTAGSVYVSTRTPGTSFTITSTSGSDTRLVAWEIFEPG